MKEEIKLKKGLLITFEGIDGSGKTTLINKIQHNDFIKSLNPIYTKEPTEKCITSNLITQSLNSKKFDPLVECFLFIANHAEHVNNIIRPQIQNKKIIFCDRYIDSRCAYQGATLMNNIKKPIKFVKKIHEQWSIYPDLTFFINIDIKTSIERCKNRNNLEKFENNKFLYFVDKNFKKIIHLEKKRFVILDGLESVDILEKKIVKIIQNLILYHSISSESNL